MVKNPKVVKRGQPNAPRNQKGVRVVDEDFASWKRWWGILTGPAVMALFAFFLGLLGLFVTTRVVELYATIRTLAAGEAWCVVAMVCLFATAVAISITYFVVAYARLRRNRQIQIDELAELSRRNHLQLEKHTEAMDAIGAYLRNYPIDDGTTNLPMSDDIRDELKQARARLLDEWLPRMKGMPDKWNTRFVVEFQDRLDKEASQRVSLAASMVAFKTAVSPNALVDIAIVSFWSFKMLGDLCRIYNLRVGTFGTIALLWRVFFVAYVAGRLDEWEDHAEETLEGAIENLPISDVARSIVGRVGVKTGAGLANFFLLHRLGRRAIQMLKPVRK